MFPDHEELAGAITLEVKDLFYGLKNALPLIARVTGGYATIIRRDGVRLHTVDSEGNEHPELDGKRFRSIKHIVRPFITASDFSMEAQSWVLPIGPFAIACSNIERIERDSRFFSALRQALPFIAKLVGGEAILFDHEGRRLFVYDAEGKPDHEKLNKISEYAADAMHANSPIVGPSMSAPGAVAARFPITEDYGFGFNNTQHVKRENSLRDQVRKTTTARYSFIDIISGSPTIHNVVTMAKNVSRGNSSILIYGETGTGKELFAQAIHNESPFSAHPFVAINCGAMPASLIESYLFGYEHGAFTGAKKGGDRGAFENADGGTLFFDEISEMDLTLQSKILRALQEREIVRIGGSKPIRVNIRVLSATNKDLWEMVQKGLFRADLYYRLNIVQLSIPPLRERKDDILALTDSFIHDNNTLFGRFIFSVSEEAGRLLLAHTWPGNVRELKNCIEYCFNMIDSHTRSLMPEHLPPYIQDQARTSLSGTNLRVQTTVELQRPVQKTLAEVVAAAERAHIAATLFSTGGSRQKAAQSLGISPATLWRKMRELEIK